MKDYSSSLSFEINDKYLFTIKNIYILFMIENHKLVLNIQVYLPGVGYNAYAISLTTSLKIKNEYNSMCNKL